MLKETREKGREGVVVQKRVKKAQQSNRYKKTAKNRRKRGQGTYSKGANQTVQAKMSPRPPTQKA